MGNLRRTVPLALAAVGAVVAYRAGRNAQLAFGTTEAERAAVLPGDELTPGADLVATRAVGIDAPPAQVWPWLVQMGQGRGGFYTYDALENLAGCDIHSADALVEEWQHLTVGDEVRLAPEVALRVAVLEPGRALVLHGAAPVDDDGPMPFDFTWAFVVKPDDDDGVASRLVVRERYVYRTSWADRMVEPVSWVSFVMTERMLRGIRERAERTPSGRAAATQAPR